MLNILICGHKSYAAHGFKDVLLQKGHRVIEFSRGVLSRNHNVITGPVAEINKNPLFVERIDVVFNFILLANESVERNEKYILSLIDFCKAHKVNRLIQISSISSYPNELPLIKEDTPTEKHIELKGRYGLIKAAVDNLLEISRHTMPFEIVFVRPGYIVADDNPHPFKGVAKFLGSRLAILIGDKKATLPCIRRDILHQCLAEIAIQENPLPVYLLLEDENGTKYSYFRSQSRAMAIPLPKNLFLLVANVAKALHIFNERQVCMAKGIFKVNRFDNTLTKSRLKILR